MLGTLRARSVFIAAFLIRLIDSGAVPLRMRLASSPNTTSRTQNRRFSISQRPRQRSRSRSGLARSGDRLVIAYWTVVGVSP